MRLDLDFSAQLMLYFRFKELLLEEDLEGNNELASLLSSKVDIAELSLAEGFANFKV